MLKQVVVTPAMGKRLIGLGMAAHPAVRAVLEKGTLVIVAGSTNGYVVQEVLRSRGQAFERAGFRRGLVLPPGRAAAKAEFPGDVVLVDGAWQKGKAIFDVADGLKAGDLILKGANAVDLARRRAGLLIGDPQCGTAGAANRAVAGRRARMIVPVGLEKRIPGDVFDAAAMLTDPAAEGPRMLVLPGEIFTEIEALTLLTGAEATLVAAGGVNGAEGALWLALTGADAQVQSAVRLLDTLAAEPPCVV